jgi:hypothetical protein
MSFQVVNTANSVEGGFCSSDPSTCSVGGSVQSTGQPSCPAPLSTLNSSEPIRSFVGSGVMLTSTEENFKELCNLVKIEALENSPIEIATRARVLTILNTCQCCKRHQTNKPKVYQQWVETTFHVTPNTHLECSCSCRHLARRICRECLT